MNETWLAHHGIKGMKWGVRRFENPDGTLTEAGKKRYRDKQIKEERKLIDENRKSMSDKDLDDAINRLKKEKQLHDLVNPGNAFVKAIMSDVGKKVLTTALAGAALYGGKVFVSKVFGKNKNQNLSDVDLDSAINHLKKVNELNKLQNPHFDAGDFANAVFNGGAKKK